MKMKKKLIIFLGLLISIVGIFMTNKVQAAQNIDWTIGINDVRKDTNPANMVYLIGEITENRPENRNGTVIWDLVRYPNNSDSNFEQLNNFYCIKEGLGFTNTGDKLSYNIVYDMKKEKTTLQNLPTGETNNAIKSLINNESAYNGLMALADMVYLKGVSTEQEKEELIKKAYATYVEPVYDDIAFPVALTEDDIEAIQQAAMWYFTNYVEGNDDLLNNYDKTTWLNYAIGSKNNTASSLRDCPENGENRYIQANALYKYLIDTAKTNAQSGDIDSNTTVTLYTNTDITKTVQPIITIERTKKQLSFDFSLRKYVTKVNGMDLIGENSRVPQINEETLLNGTTAEYKHRKNPVAAQTGSVITYNLTVYNEGEKQGRVTKITDQLPTGLKFSKVNTPGFTAEYDETTNQVVVTRDKANITNLEAYTEGKLHSETIEIECIVTEIPDSSQEKILTNVAWIAEAYDADNGVTITNQTGADRDSEPATIPSVNKDNMTNYTGNNNKEDLTDSNYYYKGQQDDDDFEKLVISPKSFDLKLIKRVVGVNGTVVPERIENVDITPLVNGTGTTANYELNKDPVSVKRGDIIKYTLRVYNEGEIDGYAQEISEDIPEGLEFLWSEKTGDELVDDTTLTKEEKEAIEFNQGIWDIKTINKDNNRVEMVKTDYLAKGKGAEIATDGANLIKAFNPDKAYTDTTTEKNPDYKEVSIYLKVVAENPTGTVIRNEAAVTEDADKDGNPVDDRDSKPENWVKYEDDEDYDNVKLQIFDLALRKFIIAVSDNQDIKEENYLKGSDGNYTREPKVDTSKLNKLDENGKMNTTAIYNQTKEPVQIHTNGIVVYMLRVYNEGEVDGYASEITDYLPPYLEFVDGEFNQKYGWTVSEDGRVVTTKYLDNHMVKKAETKENGEMVLSYKEVPIMCKVKDTAVTNENITNIAEITVYKDENKQTVTDRDSNPDNIKLPTDPELPAYKEDEKGDYIPGQEDDDDFEKVKLTYFDLALRKWVTQAIVTEDGKQTITETGHQPEDDPEQIVKVELDRKKLDKITVQFRYSIRITNQGDIAGYAKEITDYIPEGLKFVAKDNPGWTDEGNNVVSTRLLENKLLQPGESADVEILLTWINSKDNFGLKINTAEISEDYNDKGDVPDIDSTPDNKIPGEDDIDDAPVLLSITTGQERIYFTLGFTVLITIAGGIVLIKKFVL